MEVEIDELINTVFREQPKGPNDIQLSFVDDMELKELFEFLLMVFTKGCKIHYADSNGVVNLALCTDTEFKHIDKYMRSMGFKVIIDRYTEEDKNIINFEDMSYKNKNIHNAMPLKELKLPLNCGRDIFVISFDIEYNGGDFINN